MDRIFSFRARLARAVMSAFSSVSRREQESGSFLVYVPTRYSAISSSFSFSVVRFPQHVVGVCWVFCFRSVAAKGKEGQAE